REHFYGVSLAQIKREEALKKDFANYLHDDILQDLLSMKNLVSKAHQPEVQRLLIDTLGDLNDSIRTQMQAYHPSLLKSLTLEENIRNMLDAISEQYTIPVTLECDHKIFLVEPYNFIFYRIIKELATNAVKHSNASGVSVLLIQEQELISLAVSDNGIGMKENSDEASDHHGLSSIREQVILLNGQMTVESTPGDGTQVMITMPMRGEDSYENFISR
ncbi:MAG: ATP-binding protein, partial [Eubacterium sp.]